MKHTAVKSFWITLALWLLFAWPLPRFLLSAIPAGTTRPSSDYTIRPMEPGDHLQLLYHFWLFGDFLAGKTPWFHNLYEFNTGDDGARIEPGSYYFPFSLFFAAGQRIHGPALGWNVAGFLSLWFTLYFTWKLARRYGQTDGWAALAGIVSIALPYRWINLTGGSPTGFGMMWIPALLLGLDMAVRDASVRGGLLAGVALLMASWGDTHVFYFAGLVTPCWCLPALVRRGGFRRRNIGRLVLALSPVPIFAGFAFWCSRLMTRGMAASHAGGGRTIKEIALFSPRAEGLFSWRDLGISNHIYVGYAVAALLVAGLVLLALRVKQRRRDALVYLLLVAGIVGIAMLAMGPFSPFDGRPFTAARKFIPQYTMIRQPAKIFCLLPSLLAVAGALAASAAASRAGRALIGGLMLAAVFEFNAKFMPILCPLDSGQDAYRAAAQDDAHAPRALVLPLWPGDSHYTAVYQYYASLYRIRLVNGYRPFVPKEYIDNIFHRFESANLGSLDDAQLDALLAMGVRNILLHEDLFPEKVSPFPVGFTLKSLLQHPRLRILKHDGTVWSFRIEKTAAEKPVIAGAWRYLFPARQTTSERLKTSGDRLLTRATPAVHAPGLRWLVRARGAGSVTGETFLANRSAAVASHETSPDAWRWFEFPLPAWTGLQPVYASVRPVNAMIDRIVLAAGDWPRLNPGEQVEIPAPCFFHAGYTDLETDSVVLRKDRERHDLVFYGPKLPLDPGRYRVTVDFTTDAAADAALGIWFVACPEDREITRSPVHAGRPLQTDFRLEENLPLLLAFQYHGGGDVSIRSVTLHRLE